MQRFEKKNIIVNLGRTDAILPEKEQIPRERYRQGDRIRAFILDVEMGGKGPQIVLSRTHPGFLIKLFEQEVPEIYEGIVEVKGAAREPGGRAKIAVVSHDPDVDPVGACVGMKGTRVQSVVQELRGEKIDIVHWTPDPAEFVVRAMAPARVSKIVMDEDAHSMEVIVPDDQLSLAIGKKGQNVRLASRLTGWNLDVRSESEAEDEARRARLSLERHSRRRRRDRRAALPARLQVGRGGGAGRRGGARRGRRHRRRRRSRPILAAARAHVEQLQREAAEAAAAAAAEAAAQAEETPSARRRRAAIEPLAAEPAARRAGGAFVSRRRHVPMRTCLGCGRGRSASRRCCGSCATRAATLRLDRAAARAAAAAGTCIRAASAGSASRGARDRCARSRATVDRPARAALVAQLRPAASSE